MTANELIARLREVPGNTSVVVYIVHPTYDFQGNGWEREAEYVEMGDGKVVIS